MSRWKSPQSAARRAEREAKEAEATRREKRITWLLVIAFALLSLGFIMADYLFLRYAAQQQHERIHPHARNDTNEMKTQPEVLQKPTGTPEMGL